MEYIRFLGGLSVLFIMITMQAMFFQSRLRIHFELAVPISIMVDMIVLLFAGLVCSNLLIGVYAIVLLSLVGLLILVIEQRKCRGKIPPRFISSGFVIFFIGFFLCGLVSVFQIPHAWDDYGHWLPFVKQMVAYDKLYSDPSVYLMKQWYYTPGVSLLQYLLCKLVGGFSESACYSISTLIMFVSALPLVGWIEKRSIRFRVFSLTTIFASMYIVAREDLDGFFLGFRSAYVDVPLAAVSVLLLCLIIFEKESYSKVVCIGIVSVFLTMMKVTGIMFALLGIGTYILIVFIEMFICKKENKYNFTSNNALEGTIWNIKNFLVVVLPVFAVGAVYLVWNGQTRPEIEFGSVSEVTINGLILQLNEYGKGLTLREFPFTWEWIRTYFYYFFEKTINNGALIELTSSVFIITFWIVLLVSIYMVRKSRLLSVRLFISAICITAGLFVYLMAIGISFYSFEENLETMTSFKRYLSSYMGIVIIMIFILGINLVFTHLNCTKKIRNSIVSFVIIMLVVLVPTEIFPVVFGQTESEEYKEYYNSMKKWGENLNKQLNEDVIPDLGKIFLIKTGHDNLDTPSLAADVAMPGYFVLPTELQEFSQYRYDPDSSLPFYTCEEWKNVLLDYEFDGVLLANYSIPALYWNKIDTESISKMYSLFDIPPEELNYDAPMYFDINVDDAGEVHLSHVLVETPINK